MQLTSRWTSLAGIAAVALATVGCGGGETTVRPFVKRGGDGATEKTPDKTPTEKTGVEKTSAEKTPAEPTKSPQKTDGKT